MQVTEMLDIQKIWQMFDFHYSNPKTLNKKEAAFITLKNHAYENNWALPRTIAGWVYVEAWFDNMVAGQPARRGATMLQWRPDMGLPIFLDGYDNSNNGATLWFIPQVAIGGDSPWNIRFEFEFSGRGNPAFARLFAE